MTRVKTWNKREFERLLRRNGYKLDRVNGSHYIYTNGSNSISIKPKINKMVARRLIKENNLKKSIARISELCREYAVESIVLGLPKNMNNTVGDRAQKSEELKAALERRTGLPVELWDERLTTVAAERVLMESGVRREHRKESVDQIAAAMILQGYLDHLSMTKKEDGENNG